MRTFALLLLSSLCLLVARAADYSESVLVNLSGVGLEARPINLKSDLFELEAEDLEERALRSLEEAGVRVLSAAEMEVMPGQPYLEISLDVAHAQGPSHLYVLKLELREMARLERPKDRVVAMSLPTWERKIMGVANRPEAITEELHRLLRIFADEYHLMNQKEE